MSQYSQIKAMLAITKASLAATFKSPQSIFFSLFFPIVLIWIFGSIGGRGGIPTVDVAWEKGVDSSTFLYQKSAHEPSLKFADPKKKDIEDELRKGRITAVLNVVKNSDTAKTPYSIQVRTSSTSQRELPQLYGTLKKIVAETDALEFPNQPTSASIQQTVVEGRKYAMIDFMLPGMIGFSLIGSAVFGIAFLFYSLRETLVLKRMYATPIKKRIYHFRRKYIQGALPVVDGSSADRLRVFRVRVLPRKWLHHFSEHAGALFSRLAGIHGFWFFNQRHFQKPKRHSHLRQSFYVPPILPVGNLFSKNLPACFPAACHQIPSAYGCQ